MAEHSGAGAGHGPIELYLTSVRAHLTGLPTRRRARVMAEITDHLYCAAADLTDDQAPDDMRAEAEAVRRFGAPDEVAAGWLAVHAGDLLRRAVWTWSCTLAAVAAATMATGAGPLLIGGLVNPAVTIALFVATQTACATAAVAACLVWLVRRSCPTHQDAVHVRRGCVVSAGALAAALVLRVGGVLTDHGGDHGLWLAGVATCAGIAGAGLVSTVRQLRRAVSLTAAIRSLLDYRPEAPRTRALGVAARLAAGRTPRSRRVALLVCLVATRVRDWQIVAATTALGTVAAAQLGAMRDGLTPSLAAHGSLRAGVLVAAVELASVPLAAATLLPALGWRLLWTDGIRPRRQPG